MPYTEAALVFLLFGFVLGFCAALALTPKQQAPAPEPKERDPADWWKDA